MCSLCEIFHVTYHAPAKFFQDTKIQAPLSPVGKNRIFLGLGVVQIFGTTGFGKCLLTPAKIKNEKDVHFVTDSVCTKFDKVYQKTF